MEVIRSGVSMSTIKEEIPTVELLDCHYTTVDQKGHSKLGIFTYFPQLQKA